MYQIETFSILSNLLYVKHYHVSQYLQVCIVIITMKCLQMICCEMLSIHFLAFDNPYYYKADYQLIGQESVQLG